jgi:thiol-disulfide isomerase/thioredoxin
MLNKKVDSAKFLAISISVLVLWFVHGCSTKNLIWTEKVGSIFVESNIPGANITVDNVATGKQTPDTLSNVKVGSHLIEVEKEGYLPSPTSIIVEVKADTIVQASFVLLDLKYGSLWVNSNVEGAYIAIDHVSTDKQTPFLFDHNIPVGTHIVSVFKEGHSNDAPAKEVDSITTKDTVEVNFVLSPAEVGRAVGNITPDFELEDDYGTWHRLYAYRGFVTMINFWATDCPNCMKELPYLQQIYTEYDGDSLIIFGINDGGSFGMEGFDEIRQTREQKFLTFMLLKGGGTGVKSDYELEVTGTPVTIILDRGGKIYYYMVGFKASWEEKLKQKLDELFSK